MAGVILSILAAGEVSLALALDVPCVSQPRVIERLEGAGLTVVASPSRRLAVTVKKVEDRLRVEGVRSGVAFARSIPVATGGCAPVERALVVIITSWSKQLPVVPVARAASPPEPVAAAAPPTPPPEPEPVAEEGPVPEVEALVEVEVPVVEAPPVLDRPVIVGKPLVASPPPREAQASSLVIDAALLGGAAIGPSTSPTMSGQLSLGAGIERIGAVIEAGLQSAHASELNRTRVEVSLQWASVLARVRFRPIDAIQLEASLGPRAWRLSAISTGPDASTNVVVFGGVAALGGSLRIAGPFSVHARWYGSLRSQIDRFVVADVGPVLELQPWETGLLLGVEVRLFGFHEAR